MWAYVRRRLVLALITYWAIATFVFGLLHLTGDPVSGRYVTVAVAARACGKWVPGRSVVTAFHISTVRPPK